MANKNHKFVVTLSMDDNIIASRARYIEEYPESIVYSLRLNQLLNDMCDQVTEAMRENDIERVWGIVEGFHNKNNRLPRRKPFRKDNREKRYPS